MKKSNAMTEDILKKLEFLRADAIDRKKDLDSCRNVNTIPFADADKKTLKALADEMESVSEKIYEIISVLKILISG